MQEVSFDFDGTLDLPEVQEFCRTVIAYGCEVWITTLRYTDEVMAARHRKKQYVGYDNAELYAICADLGIPRSRIIFCNETSKNKALLQHNFAFHLDNDPYILFEIAHDLPHIGVNVTQPRWQQKCLEKLAD
jgi:hypothetical protein